MEEIAKQLTNQIQQKAPSYSVVWNPKSFCWPGDQPGMFEVWANGSCHYRRRTAKEIEKLIND
jgi:hypothetical protein